MDIHQLLELIKLNNDCMILPTKDLPDIPKDLRMPNDVLKFYQLCGGVHLFQSSAFPTLIVPPDEFVPANPVIFSNVEPKQLDTIRGDISWTWYMLGIGPNSQYITIDLCPIRLGLCYDSFWIRHPRDSRIIAKSFTDLLTRLWETKGEYYYWDESSFKSFGSPYDL